MEKEKKPRIPQDKGLEHDIVCEFLGQIDFKRGQGDELELVEALAGQSYSSAQGLVNTVKHYATKKSLVQAIKSFKENPKSYWSEPFMNVTI